MLALPVEVIVYILLHIQLPDIQACRNVRFTTLSLSAYLLECNINLTPASISHHKENMLSFLNGQ